MEAACLGSLQGPARVVSGSVRARSVSLALLGGLGTYLKRVQREPGLVFRPVQE